MADEDIVAQALEEYKDDKDGWSHIYDSMDDDLLFLSDEPFAQWDPKLLQDRRNRPIYQVDQLSQFVHQVENEERMNTPSIEIIPDDEMTDVKKAEVVQGIIRGIEYKSNADAAYDTAGSFAIRGSLGFIRVDHKFAKDEGFEQELCIDRVINPKSCLIDRNSIQPDGSDAMRGFAFEDISLTAFEKMYPDKSPVSFGDTEAKVDKIRDKVTIAEYFKIVEEFTEYGLIEGKGPEPYDKKKKDKYKSTRKVGKRKVMRYKLSGQDVLETTTFPGKYIPIVPVYGEEKWRDGKRYLGSLIRNAKSPQQMFNLGISLDIEMLMKQPQASFMAAAGQVSGHEHEYADPTKANVLHYNVEDVMGNKLGAPQRVAPPQSAMGFINMSREAIDNIKSTLGMYSAAIGQKGNATSGKQEQVQQRESDVGNFHFPDNLVRSVTHVGKIIVCAMKTIYDTPRAVTMVDKEDNTKMIGINGKRVQGQEEDYDLKEGSYDVRVKTGPSFTTQREAAAQFGLELAQALPEMAPGFVDLVAKYRDGAGSAAYAARLKKMVDPKLLSDEEREDTEIDPQVAALTQQLQAVTAEAQAQIQALQAELESKQAETQVKMADTQIKAQELEIKKGDQQLKAQELQTKAVLEARKLDIDEAKLQIDLLKVEQDAQEVPQQTQQPSAIKLDTTGFQFMKTPEQEAIEQAQLEQELQGEAQEMQVKMAAIEQQAQIGNAIIGAIQGLAQTIQTQTQQQAQIASTPMKVIRNEQGEMTGAI
jgi:hypothetical protein